MQSAFSRRCWTERFEARFRARFGVSAVGAASAASLFLACSSAEPAGASLSVHEGDPEGPAFYELGSTLSSGGTEGSGGYAGTFVTGEQPMPDANMTPCAETQAAATLVKQPVDIIVLLDNSGSMEDEAAAVEANINVNFASMLANSAVDYRVILLTRHRTKPRNLSDPNNEEANTSVCVQVPLSNLASCDSADEPVFSPRFFQYSTKVESDNSFDIALDTYALPFANSERKDKYDNAPLGWSEWLRSGAKKVFLEVTDDDELTPDDDDTEDNVDMSASTFVSELQRMAPEHFGTDPAHPSFVFHSIVGLAEKQPVTAAYGPEEPIITAECTGNDDDVISAGVTYQELSRLTGGLRFPLCQFDGFDVVFQRIAEDVVLTRDVACDFDLPDPPPGLDLKLDNIAIAYSPGTQGSPAQFGQARGLEDCQSDAFYIVDGGRRLNLCPDACTLVRSDPLPAINVLFTCMSQLIH